MWPFKKKKKFYPVDKIILLKEPMNMECYVTFKEWDYISNLVNLLEDKEKK